MSTVSGEGRFATSSPRQNRSIEIAAAWPCATAQMMFFGPKAASPPKKTFGMVDWWVSAFSCGRPQRSNSRPMSRSIQGKEFSWPIATSTSSASITSSGSPDGTSWRRPLASYSARTFSKTMPVSRPSSCSTSFGHQEVEDGDALAQRILLLPGRGLHLLEAGADDDLDMLAAEAAGGAAAIHRGVAAAEHDDALADSCRCGRRRRRRASRCRYGCWPRPPARPGRSRSRPRGAPEPTKTAS